MNEQNSIPYQRSGARKIEQIKKEREPINAEAMFENEPVIKEKEKEQTKQYNQTEVDNLVNGYVANGVMFAQIDMALEDCIYIQTHQGKDVKRFVQPLLIARDIAKRVLVPYIWQAEQTAKQNTDLQQGSDKK